MSECALINNRFGFTLATPQSTESVKFAASVRLCASNLMLSSCLTLRPDVVFEGARSITRTCIVAPCQKKVLMRVAPPSADALKTAFAPRTSV